MFPFIPASNPFINAAQCTVASQSRVIRENVIGAPLAAVGGANVLPSAVSNAAGPTASKKGGCCPCCDHGHPPRLYLRTDFETGKKIKRTCL